jgi:hypothetical protein
VLIVLEVAAEGLIVSLSHGLRGTVAPEEVRECLISHQYIPPFCNFE